jgi:putative ABC transport system substrate-binding protein
MGVLAGGLLAAPLATWAQQPGKVPRIGLITGAAESTARSRVDAFRQALRESGFVEGRTLTVEYFYLDGRWERSSTVAAELLRMGVNVIVAHGTPPAVAAKQATSTTPIVMLSVFDAAESGLVASIARPGGNITGMSLPYRELAAKRLELLKAAMPRLTRVAFLTTGSRGGEAAAGRAMADAAGSLGLKLTAYEIDLRSPRDVDRAFAQMKTARAEALAVSEAGELSFEFRRIGQLALIHRLPSIGARPLVEGGSLMAYGANRLDSFRHAATFVDKILRGAKPADLPIEEPTKFELVINLKTAKALGLTIPPSVLARADEVIQ